MNAADYLAQLQALLPRGRAWPTDPGRAMTQLLDGLSQEPARVDARAVNLIEEADPRTTYELLTDWERATGLPDPCVAIAQTISQRRQALVARLTAQGGQTVNYYIGLAAILGFDITIEEFDAFNVEDDVSVPLFAADWAFAWQVDAPLNTVTEFTVDDGVDTPLAAWGNQPLECVIRRYAPAHTYVFFAYS